MKMELREIFPLGKMYFEGSNIDTIGIFSKFGDKKSLSILYAIIVVVFIISLLNVHQPSDHNYQFFNKEHRY